MRGQSVWWAACGALALAAACSSGGDDPNMGQPVSENPTDPSMPGNQNAAGNEAPAAGNSGGTAGQPSGGAAGTGAGAGAGGSAAPVAGNGTQPDPTMMEDPTMVDPEPEDPRGCPGLDSGFPGDEACLPPPDPSEGIQIHIGPEDYNDPADVNRFIFEPGSESSQCWTFHTPNDEQIYYQGWTLSGRPGTHHIINTMYTIELQDGGFRVCEDPGTGTNPNSLGNLPGASRAYMPREPIAPENANLGRSVPPNTPAQADMHYFNFTDAPILREFWLNLYFIPREQVMEEAHQIRGMGGLSWTVLPIAPGTDQVYPYSCQIDAPGRIIQLLGHYHAHGVRFTAWLNRNTPRERKVFEMYDYLEPAIFNYNSVTENPGFSDSAPGAVSGMLEVQPGDTLDWECHIVNDSDVGLTYTNYVETGEMCNLWGSSVGPDINCVLP